MYLTGAEHEAFMRGQAAGLIQPDTPLPENEHDIASLIFHIGVLFSAKIACRKHDGKLRVMELTTFTPEHLDELIRGLPQLRSSEIFSVTNYRKEFLPNMLEGLYNYFSFGKDIVAEKDLAGRLAVNPEILKAEQILRGFEIKYIPVRQTGLATLRQKTVLTEMIYARRLPAMSCRDWENMTKAQATKLISSVPRPAEKIPESVGLMLNAINRMRLDEKRILTSIINKKASRQQTVSDCCVVDNKK